MSRKRRRKARPVTSSQRVAGLRIIGGEFRGRPIRYRGDPQTRPMKQRVREAVFNLVGPAVKNTFVIDLFAGTGAMALEALSRGAAQAVLFERRFPNARTIEENAAALGVTDRVRVVCGDTFNRIRHYPHFAADPWLVFCCPPYDFYVACKAEMLDLIGHLLDRAPADSLLVVESDERFDTADLPQPQRWDVRHYPPAVVAIFEKSPRTAAGSSSTL